MPTWDEQRDAAVRPSGRVCISAEVPKLPSVPEPPALMSRDEEIKAVADERANRRRWWIGRGC
jgi:hypothetical protein